MFESAMGAEFRLFRLDHAGRTPVFYPPYDDELKMSSFGDERKAMELCAALHIDKDAKQPFPRISMEVAYVLSSLPDKGYHPVWRDPESDEELLRDWRAWRERCEREHPGAIPVVSNGCYGGYRLSLAGDQLGMRIRSLLREKDIVFEAEEDQDVVEAFVVETLGEAARRPFPPDPTRFTCSPHVEWFPREDAVCIRSSEHDGLERVWVDKGAQRAERAHRLLLRIPAMLADGGGGASSVLSAIAVYMREDASEERPPLDFPVWHRCIMRWWP